jgi:epoxyqueuosine reductase
MTDLNIEITNLMISRGASLVGFADLREIDADARNGMPFGVSIAVALNPLIIAGINDGPNKQYYQEYQRANNLLDSLAKITSNYLEEKGQKTRYTAATNAGINRDTLSTILPHKTAATRAGLGWIGKCALLITREYGSAVRITTVLTDADVNAGEPVDVSQCDDCTVCVDVCPGRALTGRHWEVGIPREALYDAFACRETAGNFEKEREGVYDNICGICIAACPWTKRYLNQTI